MSRMIKASEFKAKCLAVLDEAERTRRLQARKAGRGTDSVRHQKRELWGILKDELFIEGDIVSPIDVEWEALK
jgi:hypothetical protein